MAHSGNDVKHTKMTKTPTRLYKLAFELKVNPEMEQLKMDINAQTQMCST